MRFSSSLLDPVENGDDAPEDTGSRKQQISRLSRFHRRPSLTADPAARKGIYRRRTKCYDFVRSFRLRVLAVDVFEREAIVGFVDRVGHRAGNLAENGKHLGLDAVPILQDLLALRADPLHAGILTPLSAGGKRSFKYQISAMSYRL